MKTQVLPKNSQARLGYVLRLREGRKHPKAVELLAAWDRNLALRALR